MVLQVLFDRPARLIFQQDQFILTGREVGHILIMMNTVARSFVVVRETWLTKQPRSESLLIAAASTFALTAGSFLGWSKHGPGLEASALDVFGKGEFWRLWTTIFIHADAAHLLSNAFLFFIFGFFLYGYFGLRLFPLSALFWGGVANAIVLKTYEPDIHLIGASGVVYWMGGVWLVLYFFLSRQKNIWHRSLRSLGVALLLFAPSETLQANVSHRTHFAGFCLGILFGFYHYARRRDEFLKAEVRETVYEDLQLQSNSMDSNPPLLPQTLSSVWPERSSLARYDHQPEGGLTLRLDPALVRMQGFQGEVSHDISQPVRVIIRELHTSDGWPEQAPHHQPDSPRELTSIKLELETGVLTSPWPIPTSYEGSVRFVIEFEDLSEPKAPFVLEGRGLMIEAAGPGRLLS